ncbi:hypothetical protein T01_13260, partial [Trichinella spiralis]
LELDGRFLQMQLHSCAAYLLENQQSYRELFKENKFLKSRTFLHPKSFDARTPETPGRISRCAEV